jgi:hypothetical protein
VQGSLVLAGTSVFDASFIRAYGTGGLVFLVSLQSPIDAIYFPATGLVIKSDKLRYTVTDKVEKMMRFFNKDFSLMLGWEAGRPAASTVFLSRDRRPYHVIADELSGLFYLRQTMHKRLPVAFLERASYLESDVLSADVLSVSDVQQYGDDKILFTAYKRLTGSDPWTEDFRAWLVRKSIEVHNDALFDKTADGRIIWIGIARGEKRVWKEELEGLVEFVGWARNKYPGCRFVFDGWTSLSSATDKCCKVMELQKSMFDNIVEQTGLVDAEIKNTIGAQVARKIALASQCDFFISSAGTPAFWPSGLCGVPGVVHNSTQMINKVDVLLNCTNVLKVPVEFIRDSSDISGKEKKRYDYVDYSINPDDFIRCCEAAADGIYEGPIL